MAKIDVKDSTKKALEFDKKHHVLTLVLMFLAAGGFLWAIFEKESHKKDLEGVDAEIQDLTEKYELMNKMADIDEIVIFDNNYQKALKLYQDFPDSINVEIQQRVVKRENYFQELFAEGGQEIDDKKSKVAALQKELEFKEKKHKNTVDSLKEEVSKLSRNGRPAGAPEN